MNHRGGDVQPSPSITHVDHHLAGDASGCGLYLMQSSGVRRTLISESLSPEEVHTSSTLREILVFLRFYCSDQATRYRGQKLVHYTDNQAAASILVKGSRKVDLHNMAVQVYLACQAKGITLQPIWKRRNQEEMVVADMGSRGPWDHLSEFQLDFVTMRDILATQEFTLDAMASRLNAIVPRYFSRAMEVEALGHIFFAQEWGVEEHLWVNPPPQLFVKVLRKLLEQRAHGAAVFHLHPGYPGYSVFIEDGHLPRLVTWFKVVRPAFVGDQLAEYRGKQRFDSVIFGFDCSGDNPLSTNRYRSHCLQDGCSRCFN